MKRLPGAPSWWQWLQKPSGVSTLCQDAQTHQLKPPQVEEASSAVTLLCHPCPRGIRAGLPQRNELIICVRKLREEQPIWQNEAFGLNSALGYVPATLAADSAPPLALRPGARVWAFLGSSKSFTPKSTRTKWRKKLNSEGKVAAFASAGKHSDSPSRVARV